MAEKCGDITTEFFVEDRDGMIILTLVGQIDVHLKLSSMHPFQLPLHRMEEKGKKISRKEN